MFMAWPTISNEDELSHLQIRGDNARTTHYGWKERLSHVLRKLYGLVNF
jgi:hypothetical protein